MKRLWLVVGAGIGFVLGSRMGREPYERIESKVRQVSGRPAVKNAVHIISDRADDAADTVMKVAADKVEDISERVQTRAKAMVK
jgi:hypothetical protein